MMDQAGKAAEQDAGLFAQQEDPTHREPMPAGDSLMQWLHRIDHIVTTRHINLEAYKNSLAFEARPVPLLFLTKLLRLAFGANPRELDLQSQLVPTACAVVRATFHTD